MRTFVEYFPIKQFFRGLKLFGFPSIYWYYESIHKIKQGVISRLIPKSLEILKESNHESVIEPNSPIFFMWWQGAEQMPEVVKLCYSQLCKCANGHPIYFLNKENIKDVYIDLTNQYNDCNIIDYCLTNNIRIQHLSDILRNKLLYHCGGIWIDATVFLTKDIDFTINGLKYFSARRDSKYTNNYFPSRGKWSSYFIASGAGCLLHKFLYSGLEEIVLENGEMPDYFTLDYLFYIAYEKNADIKTMINSTPIVEPIVGDFNDVSLSIDKQEFNEKISRTPLFKLDWRKYDVNSKDSKKTTIFQYLKQYNDTM